MNVWMSSRKSKLIVLFASPHNVFSYFPIVSITESPMSILTYEYSDFYGREVQISKKSLPPNFCKKSKDKKNQVGISFLIISNTKTHPLIQIPAKLPLLASLTNLIVLPTSSAKIINFNYPMWHLLRRQTWGICSQIRWKSSKTEAEAKFKQKIQTLQSQSAKNLPEWTKREQALRKRYGAWNPTRKLSRQQIWDIRELKQQWPQMKTKQLADHFHINPESIRRILKSKWNPNEEELASINKRAERRKLESQERKLANLKGTQAKGNYDSVVRKLPVLKSASQKYSRKHKREGQNQDRGRKIDRNPFTTGVGDLID